MLEAGAATGTATTSSSSDTEAPMRMLEAQVAAALPFHTATPSSGAAATAGTATASTGTPLSLTKEQIFERALGVVIASDDTSKHLFFFELVAAAMLPGVWAKLEEEQKQVCRGLLGRKGTWGWG